MGNMKVTCQHPDAASAEGARRATGAGADRADKEVRRWSAKRDLETLSRQLGVTAARLSEWREDFLAGGEAQLKARAAMARDREIRELQRKLGEITMENELLREKARRLEERAPGFPWRRSNR